MKSTSNLIPTGYQSIIQLSNSCLTKVYYIFLANFFTNLNYRRRSKLGFLACTQNNTQAGNDYWK